MCNSSHQNWERQFQRQILKLRKSGQSLNSEYFHKLSNWLSEAETEEEIERRAYIFERFTDYQENHNNPINDTDSRELNTLWEDSFKTVAKYKAIKETKAYKKMKGLND